MEFLLLKCLLAAAHYDKIRFLKDRMEKDILINHNKIKHF